MLILLLNAEFSTPFKMASQLNDVSASSDPNELWPIYKAEHKKNYEPEEDTKRFEIFKTNLQRIVEHNDKYAKGEVTYSMGINQFTDKTSEEFRKHC